MNIRFDASDPAHNLVTTTEDPATLQTFLEEPIAGTVLRRQMPEDAKNWLATLDPDKLPRGRVILPPSAIGATVNHLCDMASTPLGAERSWLEADIKGLAQTFAKLMSVKFLRMRLDVVTTNACRKFHIDAINARLICTYRGTGTQYGYTDDGSEPQHIHTVATGDPILLRGTAAAIRPPEGLLHRSPPIEGTDETRLLLVLNPIEENEVDPHQITHNTSQLQH